MRAGRIGKAAALAGTIAAFAVGLAACGGSSSEESQGGPAEEVCAQLDDFSSALAQLQALDPETASTEDIQTAVKNVRSAAEDVTSSTQEAALQAKAVLDNSIKALETTAKSLPSTGSVQGNLQQLEPTIDGVQSNWNTYVKNLGCEDS